MGLLGSKKKVFVASVAYNLAGDENLRPNYLKSLVIGNVIGTRKTDIAGSITNGYRYGSGMKFRNFYRWAEDNYDDIGIPGSNIGTHAVDVSVLQNYIPYEPGETVEILYAEQDDCDHSVWAEQWMSINHPDLAETSDWTSDFDEDTNEIVIIFADTSEARFTPANFDTEADYIYAQYRTVSGETTGPVSYGPIQTVASEDDLPAITIGSKSTGIFTENSLTLNSNRTIVYSYSDGRPNETDTDNSSVTMPYLEGTVEYNYRVYEGQDPNVDRLYATAYYTSISRSAYKTTNTTVTTVTYDIGGGVTRTTTTTEVVDQIVLDLSYKLGQQDITLTSWSPYQYFIYKVGSGNAALDSMVERIEGSGGYFPVMPIRLENKFLSTTNKPEAYELVKKAYKKAVNGSLDELIDKVSDNEKLKDIDHAFVVFGVSLNVKENSCRKYIYEYFLKLMDVQTNNWSKMLHWEEKQEIYFKELQDVFGYREAQKDPLEESFGKINKTIKNNRLILPKTSVTIKSEGSLDIKYNVSITWNAMTEISGNGLLKPDAKPGDVWFDDVGQTGFDFDWVGIKATGHARLNWQVSATKWRSILIKGMKHVNKVYKNKAVEIDIYDALEDEDESGFIIPLHYQTYKEMGLKDATQMATACCFIVFNCYKIVKVKWYQRGIFKIIIMVAIVIAVTWATGGLGTPGILGANLAVGTAIGLTGMAAVITGAIANAIAAMLLTKIISMGAIAIFGEKLGMIIGAVASFIALNIGTALSNGASMSAAWGNMMSAQNIMMLTSSVGSGISGYLQAATMDIVKKTQTMIENYEDKYRDISDLYAQNIGYDRALLDPMSLVDFTDPTKTQYMTETEAQFLSRTLMTGSDIAEVTNDMLSNFADLTLSVDLTTNR